MTDRLASFGRYLAPRATAIDGPDSLSNIITTPLPNGAQCYVIASRQVFTLDKSSTATPDGIAVIMPNGGGGRWIVGAGAGTLGGAVIFKSATQSIPNNVLTTVTFDTSDMIGTGVRPNLADNSLDVEFDGFYMIVHGIAWEGNGAVTSRLSSAFRDGVGIEFLNLEFDGTGAVSSTFTQFAPATAGQSFTLRALQAGVAGGLNISGATRLCVLRLN